MAEKLTHEEFDRRVTEAMKPPAKQGRQNFSPGIQRMRQAGRQRSPMPIRPQLPLAR